MNSEENPINVVNLSFSRDYIYSGDESGGLIQESAHYLTDTNTKEKEFNVLPQAHNKHPITAMFCSKKGFLYTGDTSGILKKWAVPSMKKTQTKIIFSTAIFKIVATDDR